MKVYVQTFNGILDLVKAELIKKDQYTENIHEADCILTWQDVRGIPNRLCSIIKQYTNKPVFVVQHGRGATRDYDKPNSFPLLADKFLAWGPSDRGRMQKLGYGDRTSIVGSPLFSYMAPRIPHPEKRVLFCPIIMEKEEPENIQTYARLKEWELRKLRNKLDREYKTFKQGWAIKNITFREQKDADLVQSGVPLDQVPHQEEIIKSIPANILLEEGLLSAKLTGIHDIEKYECERHITNQNQTNHIPAIIDLLRRTDVVVCIEDGTLPLLAMALNIPVIHVDIFKYVQYGGIDYSTVEKIKSSGCYRTDNLEDLPDLVNYCIYKDQENKLKKELRIKTVEDELGPQYGNPVQNILNEIETYMSEKAESKVWETHLVK